MKISKNLSVLFKYVSQLSVCLAISIFLCQATFGQKYLVPSKYLLKKQMVNKVTSFSHWFEKMNRNGFDFICFGESHNKFYRELLANKVIPHLSLNVLAVEKSSDKTINMLQELSEGKDISVTGEEFNSVLNSYKKQNPKGLVIGIEQTSVQKRIFTDERIEQLSANEPKDYVLSRDANIAANADLLIKKWDRVMAIYGSKHCSYYVSNLGFDTPFFRLLKQRHSTKKIIAIRVVQRDEQPVLQSFLREFELMKKGDDVAIEGLKDINPMFYNYNLDLFTLAQSADVILMPAKKRSNSVLSRFK